MRLSPIVAAASKRSRRAFALAVALLAVAGCKSSDVTSATPAAAASYTNIAYGTNAAQIMDIVLPAGRSSATATVVMIHGGGWSGGDKSIFTAYDIAKFTARGYAVANINYRLASNAANVHDPVMSNDVSAALAFLTAHASEYRIRAGAFGLVGHSAGAHLALLAGYKNDPSHTVKVIASLSGPTDLNDATFLAIPSIRQTVEEYLGVTQAAQPVRWTSASPVSVVVAGAPPTIVVHGSLDVLVPLSQAQKLEARLATLGVGHANYINPLYNHDLGYAVVLHFPDDVWSPVLAFFDPLLRAAD